MTMSHGTIYQLSMDSNHLPVCSNVRCEVDKYFHWLGEDLCKMSAYCSKLAEDPCESFGMLADYPDYITKLCHEHRLYHFELGPRQSFRGILWYTADSELTVDCYFWCTSDGEVPTRQHDRRVTEEALQDLVTTF